MTANFHPGPPEADLLVVVAPFGLTGSVPGRAVPVDADGLDGVLARHPALLSCACPDRLGDGGRPFAVAIALTRFRDLAPGRLVDQVPELARLRAVRQALLAGQRPDQAAAGLERDRFGRLLEALVPASTSAAGAPPAQPDTGAAPSGRVPPAPTAAPDDLDALFAMVDAPSAAPTNANANANGAGDAATPLLSPLFSAIARDGRSTAAAGVTEAPSAAGLAAVAAPVATVEAFLIEQLVALIETPAFRAFEAAWRGLRLLLDRLLRPRGHRPRLRLALLDSAGAEPHRVLEDWAETGMVDTGPPLAVLVDGTGAGTSADVQAWAALAKLGESLQAPVIASAGPGLFGGADWAAVQALRDPETVLQGDAYQPWNALRDRSASRWLCLAVNGPVLRGRLDLHRERALALGPAGAAVGAPLIGAPAWAVGALLVDSIAGTGWPTELTADRDARLDGLDLTELVSDRAGTVAHSPLEALLPVRLCDSLANAGLAPLTGYSGRDTVLLARAAAVHRPTRVPEDEDGHLSRLFSSLPYQLLLALVLRRLERWLADPALPADAERRSALQAALADLLADSGPGATVTVTAAEDGGLDIALRTGRGVLGGAPVSFDL